MAEGAVASSRARFRLGLRYEEIVEANDLGTDNGRYSHVRALGNGGFAVVFESRDKTTFNRPVAIKMVSQAMPRDALPVQALKEPLEELQRSAEREVSLLATLRHQHVLRFERSYSYTVGHECVLCIVTELCSGGTLTSALLPPSELSRLERKRFMRQVAAGVGYLHSCGIVHTDLKPDNILLDAHRNIKIADFGLSSRANGKIESGDKEDDVAFPIDALHKLLAILGSSRPTPYFAPEVLDESYSFPSDVFTLGLLFAVMTNPKHFVEEPFGRKTLTPFTQSPRGQALYLALRSDPSKRQRSACILLGIGVGEDLAKLIDWMLSYEPRSRPTIQQVIDALDQKSLC